MTTTQQAKPLPSDRWLIELELKETITAIEDMTETIAEIRQVALNAQARRDESPQWADLYEKSKASLNALTRILGSLESHKKKIESAISAAA